MTTALVGIVLALAIGIACRWLDIPVPAPPRLQGALLVVAMTAGFLVADTLINSRHGVAPNRSDENDSALDPNGHSVSTIIGSQLRQDTPHMRLHRHFAQR